MNQVSPLLSVQDVRGLLDQPQVKLFDVRGTWSSPLRAQPEEYEAGHIPGAVFLDWTAEFVEQGSPVALADVSDEAGTRASFKKLGIDESDLVVLYDDYHNMQAGRIWWAMRYWGFENVRVLDGGLASWKAEGLPLSMAASFPTHEGNAQPRRQSHWRIDIDSFVASHSAACLMDARGPVNYAGDPDDPRSGHIPGAVHVPFSSVLDPDTGRFLDDDALRRVFDTAAPEWQSRQIITSCGSGYAGTVVSLALAKLGVASTLFDGSMGIWKSDPDRPLTQGTTP